MINEKKNVVISIVVPLYQGKKYLTSLLAGFEENQSMLGVEASLEVIIINDDPSEKVDGNECALITKVVNHQKNMGIQKSRMEGIGLSRGEYICMMDQDDILAEDFLKKQYDKLICDHADIVVSNVIHQNSIFYGEQNPIQDVSNLNNYISKGNRIITPGQVLMKKRCIPATWLQNPLTCNGADDFYLWILILLEKKWQFTYNEDVFFKHTKTEKNLSDSAEKMYDSIIEMCRILRSQKGMKRKVSEEIQYGWVKRYIREYEEVSKVSAWTTMSAYIINAYYCLLELREQHPQILLNLKSDTIAIYGMNEVCFQFIRFFVRYLNISHIVRADMDTVFECSIPSVDSISQLPKVDYIINTCYTMNAKEYNKQMEIEFIDCIEFMRRLLASAKE